jgi:hypothetical protein
MQFNDLYCLAHPEVHTLSCGASRPQDFDEHLAALKWKGDLPATETRLRAEMQRVLGADWCQRWFEGLPNYTECPGHINLIEILRLWTYAKSLDLIDWAKMRYNLLGQGDHWFPGENASKAAAHNWCTFLAGSPFAARIPAILQEAHQMLLDQPKQRLSRT